MLILNLLLIPTVDCVWGEWQNASCSTSCGFGMMLRTRNKTTEAAFGGNECEGANSVNITCNTIECPGNSLFQIVAQLVRYVSLNSD